MWRRWQRRLRYWLHSAERARLLREEMELHLQLKAQELMEDGMAEADAHNFARRQFGNLTLQEEASRGTWVARWLSDLLQDTAFAARVSPRFFDTLGIRMVDGEDFRPGVHTDDIVIVNQALAGKAFPKENPIGRSISYLDRKVRIVGLVATAKSRTIGEEPHPCLYFPIARDARGNDSLTGITLMVRTRGNPAGYAIPVSQAIRRIDPALALFDVRTMDAQISQALFLPRLAASLFGLAGLMGLLISTVGIYGVISFSVARQTRDIGIRIALGARRGQVLGRVMRQGLTLTLAGSAIGLGVAWALSRTAASLLYGVSATDTLTFLAVPILLLLLATVACLVPARRAAALDPIRALRCE
jgi:FtsX-like permease family